MPKGHRRLLVLGLILLDILAVAIAMTAAYRAVSAVGRAPEPFGYPWPLAIVIPVAIGLLALNRLYVLDELLEGPAEYGRIAYGCTLMAFGLSVIGFWVRVEQGVPSRKLIVLVWLFSCLAVGGGRFLARRIVRALRRRGYLVSRALIVGLGSPGISLARHFGEIKHAGIQVVGFVDDFLPPGTPVTDGLKVLGPPSALPRILQQTGATEVIVVPTAMAWESFQDLIRTAADLNGHSIRLVPGLRDILATNVKVHQLGFTPLLTIERVRITGLDAVLKRILDYGTAILLLPLALPLLLLMSLALAMAGIRPFRSFQAIGREGFAFRAFLLNVLEPRNAIQRFAHQFGLDKLPQLVNVFGGQMSIVGPRAIPFGRRKDYERWIPNLLTVKPGITGPWAVHGTSESLDDEMQMNLFYIRNYAIWLDLEIMARSVFRLLAGRSPLAGREETAKHERVTVHR